MPRGSPIGRLPPVRRKRPPKRPPTKRPGPPKRPKLYIATILKWADAHHRRTGRWPRASEQRAPLEAPFERWRNVDRCLREGLRGCRSGGSLAELLFRFRGVPMPRRGAPLTIRKILAWADAHRRRTGRWPAGRLRESLPEAPRESWAAINMALSQGNRGLPGGDTLAQLLLRHRGVRRITYRPRLTIAQILAWADAHHDRTGAWPRKTYGHIAGTRDETWNGMHEALLKGRRGLRGGCTLATLLERHRGVRHKQHAPRFSVRRIRTWAVRYRRETGRWPTVWSGPIPESPADTWGKVNSALLLGYRGMPGAQALSALLHGRGAPASKTRSSRPDRRRPRPDLSVEGVLHWADDHFRRKGAWPKLYSGPVAGSGGETWLTVDRALRRGRRGLPGGSSLALLLARERGVRYQRDLP